MSKKEETETTTVASTQPFDLRHGITKFRFSAVTKQAKASLQLQCESSCSGEKWGENNNICLPGEEGKRAAPCQDHRGEDAQSNPAGAPQSLLLHVEHTLQRPERTFNHMAETHAQNEENKRGRGWHRGREGQAQSKAEKVGEGKCEKQGPLKRGGRGQVSGEEREERKGDI